ncbi:MAG: ankyrin repeat domain-containing protein [Acidobacteria bacterium]|nr:ankyrin repeat domain-containing protein [Acidobacteriota bacterium]
MHLAIVFSVLAVVAMPSAETASIADAAMNRDMAAVRSLLARGVDVNAAGPDGTTALHWVVRVDDVETAALLIRSGARVTMPNRYGATPLYLACSIGNEAMIRLLLDAGAEANSVDSTGESALMTAIRSGKLNAVKLLLDRGAAVDARDPAFQQTALMLAVRENHSDIIRLLIDRGADVNAKTRTGPAPRFELPNSRPGFSNGVGIVRGGWSERGLRAPIPGAMFPLLYAARDGGLDAARILLDAGANVNQTDANGITPLLLATLNNQIGVARFLVDRGADINARDWYGRTPLWAAVEVRNMDKHNAAFENGVDRGPVLELIRILLEKGANPNSRTVETVPIRTWMMGIGSLSWVDFTGQTPFLLASLAGDLSVMHLLLKHGADPLIPTFGGTTALMAAAGINWVVDQTYDEGPKALLETVKFCWELGMDVNGVNSMGLAAIHGAANRGSDDIIQFLVDKGAKLDIADKEGRTPLTWANGVFLATHAAVPKPSSIVLIKRLTGQ